MNAATVKIFWASILALLVTQASSPGCWVGYEQSFIASHAPIIVLGEIVAVDTAKGQWKERNQLRYIDAARIKVEKVYKNALSDVKVEEKGEITAFMHSTNPVVPGSEKEGQHLVISVSTDLHHKAGTRGVWFLFLNPDGKFYINRHPQQRLPLEKGDKTLAGVALGAIGETFSKAEWMKENKSCLFPAKKKKEN